MSFILLLFLAASCQASCVRDQELEEGDMLQQEQEQETVTLYDVEIFRRLRADTEEDDDDNPTPAVGIIFY